MLDLRTLLFSLGFLVVLVTCIDSDQDDKRSVEVSDDDVLGLSADLDDIDEDKRNYLMRYGKRGNLMRYGKRGNLMRYGKRGNLMRYGKREDNEADQYTGMGGMFRYGKRDADDATAYKRLFRYGKRSDYDDSDLYEDKRTTLMRYGKRSDDTISADELEYAKRLFRYGKRSLSTGDEQLQLAGQAPLSWEEAKRTLMRYGRSAQTGAHVPFRFGDKE